MTDLDRKAPNDWDIIIVGAGISGINAAYRIQTELPWASYTIIEARDAIGGTWDLFRYPGIRSDSDMQTFGFPWRPWKEERTIASGEDIRQYIRDSASLYGIDRKIQFHHKLSSADWSSDQQMWTLDVEAGGEKKQYHARFVMMGTGYYDYDEPLAAQIPGLDRFQGKIIHPQFWPEDYDSRGKRIVVVGSGATAVTLVPVLAKTAEHVTMLQRSPTYIVSRPSIDPFRRWMLNWIPNAFLHKIVRVKNLILTHLFIKFCNSFPVRAKGLIRKATMAQLPSHIPHDPHFQPRYNPWEQRLCMCPDGDFFESLKDGKASIATDSIETVTETGIKLSSGEVLDADMIVTATGLKLKVAGGAQISVDHKPLDFSSKFLWKAAMLQDVPNMAVFLGYTTLSWTLGADATALLLARLLTHMRTQGITCATPRLANPEKSGLKTVPALNLSSTYITKGAAVLPKAGDKAPWLPRKTYFSDIWMATHSDVTQALEFQKVST